MSDQDKMLDIDEGPSQAAKTQEETKAGPEEEKKKGDQKKPMLNRDQIYEVMKALTAMKLTKEDNSPGMVFPELYLGSIGAAYNKKTLTDLGITHILTCASGIKKRFPDDFKYEILNCLDSPNQNIL